MDTRCTVAVSRSTCALFRRTAAAAAASPPGTPTTAPTGGRPISRPPGAAALRPAASWLSVGTPTPAAHIAAGSTFRRVSSRSPGVGTCTQSRGGFGCGTWRKKISPVGVDAWSREPGRASGGTGTRTHRASAGWSAAARHSGSPARSWGTIAVAGASHSNSTHEPRHGKRPNAQPDVPSSATVARSDTPWTPKAGVCFRATAAARSRHRRGRNA